MEKKTIGQFIAALRKANGMTQQDVAEQLNVSNKAVSRWERDECAPDITLIPALAELFGVTCDELLKGERIRPSDNEVKKEAKVEKQMKSLIHREVSKYKTMMWIALAVALVGPIVMFILFNTIYWTQDACFGVMLLFEIVAFVIETIAVTRMRDIKADCEVFESVDAVSVKKYNKCLGEFSFWVYYLIVAILSGVYLNSPYLYVVPEISGFVFWVIILAALYVLVKSKYIAWITGDVTVNNKVVEEKPIDFKKQMKLNRMQIGTILLYGAVFFFAPYFESSPDDTMLYAVVFVIAICLILVNIISAIVFVIKEKENRKELVLLGLRNIMLFPSGYLLSEVHHMGWYYENGVDPYQGDIWMWEYAIYAAFWATAVILLFSIIERLIKKIK